MRSDDVLPSKERVQGIDRRMKLTSRKSPASRPLRLLTQTKLASRFSQAVAQGKGADGAHCIHELWMRGEMAVNIESKLELLWKTCGATVPDWLPMRHVEWLPLAYEVAARFQSNGKGSSNIYMVLLDYRDSRSEPYGVYVGMTHYSPAERFDQHKAGIRAAGSVLKRGLEALAGPTLHLQKIRRNEAARIEIELAEALSEAGLFVQGGH
jgi:hypothetical protein